VLLFPAKSREDTVEVGPLGSKLGRGSAPGVTRSRAGFVLHAEAAWRAFLTRRRAARKPPRSPVAANAGGKRFA